MMIFHKYKSSPFKECNIENIIMDDKFSTLQDEISEQIEKLNWYEKEDDRISERLQLQENVIEQLKMYKAEIENKKEMLILKLHQNGITFNRHKHIFETKEEHNETYSTIDKLSTDVSKDEIYTYIKSIIKETLSADIKEQNKEKNLVDLDTSDTQSEISTSYLFDSKKSLPIISPTSLPAPLSIKRR
jgi:hypothetical protein